MSAAAVLAVALLAAPLAWAAAGVDYPQVVTCFSQLQLLATHNSYHIAPSRQLLDAALTNQIVKAVIPDVEDMAKAWEYTHPSLTQQLELGVRGFEIDIHADPEGGRYAQVAGLRLAGLNGTLPYRDLYEPGFKVLHVPDWDFNTTCRTFKGCLREIKAWSDTHPDHLPIVIHMESKRTVDLGATIGPQAAPLIKAFLDSSSAPGPDRLAVTPDLNITLMADLEAEILDVFNRSSVITPDYVRGGDSSIGLKELLLVDPTTGGCPWPNLDSMRGKVMFGIMLRSDMEVAMYEQLHPGAAGALLWLVVSGRSMHWPGVLYNAANFGIAQGGDLPENATDVALGIGDSVERAVGLGYIVRARADADTWEARFNFTGRRDAVLAAGAQLVATDYETLSQFFPSRYKVLPPGAASLDPALISLGDEGDGVESFAAASGQP